MLYKVGDKVRIKDHQGDDCGADCAGFVSDMREYVGEVTSIYYCYNNDSGYLLNIDDGEWTWSDCMLEPEYPEPINSSDIIIIN